MSCPWTENREKKQDEDMTFDSTEHHHRCPRRVVQRDIRGYEETVRGLRRRDSSPDAESCHLAHPEHYPHTESDVLRIAEK